MTTASELRIGLTGGIGSGKSTAAAQFAALGARVIDTDLLSRQLTAPGGAALPALRAAFGPAAIASDGGLDRSWMRSRVFRDAGERVKLEAVLHPLIEAEARRLAYLPGTAPYTLVVVPLLFESGGYLGWLDRVLVVDCSEAQQLQRVRQRSGWDEDLVRAIMASQLPRRERCARAQDVLSNSTTLEELQQAVRTLHEKYLRLTAGNPDG